MTVAKSEADVEGMTVFNKNKVNTKKQYYEINEMLCLCAVCDSRIKFRPISVFPWLLIRNAHKHSIFDANIFRIKKKNMALA